MFAALLISASTVNAGFGEVGGWLNFSLIPNSSQTLRWGLINDGNATLHYTIIAPNIRPNSNFSANRTPNITFIPDSGNLQPGVTYLDVQVSSKDLRINDSWTVGLEAVTTPLGNSSGGANIQLATVKMLNINIIKPVVNVNLVNLYHVALFVLVFLLVLILVLITAALIALYRATHSSAVKRPGSIVRRHKRNATKHAKNTAEKNKLSSRRKS